MPRVKDHTETGWLKIDVVVNLILENDRFLDAKRAGELIEIVMSKFDCSERQAYRYVQSAKKEIRRIGKQNKEKAFIKALRDREYLYNKAISPCFLPPRDIRDEKGKIVLVADLKLALDVAKDRDRLQGLYVDEIKVNGEIKTIDLNKLTKEQLQMIVNGEPLEKVIGDAVSS